MKEATEFELTRDRSDRRRYAFGNLGSLRLEGFFRRNATAEVGAERFVFRRSGWTRRIEAVGPSGDTVGKFEGRLLSSGGTIWWRGNELLLSKDSVWRESYVLKDDARPLARFDVRTWGGLPVAMQVERPNEVGPALLLFAAFVVRAAADDNSTAGVVASTAATTGG